MALSNQGPPGGRSSNYQTRVILTAAALGTAVGIVLVPVNLVLSGLGAFFPPIASISIGLWGMGALLPLAVLRRGGTGVIGCTATGFCLIVSPGAFLMVAVMAVWGALVELPFFVTGYRWFGRSMFLAVGVILGTTSCAISIFTYDLPSMHPGLIATICFSQVVSFVIGSLTALSLARTLEREGITGGAHP